jgi:hypothetical protein
MSSEISIVPVAAAAGPAAAAEVGFASDTSTDEVTAAIVPKEIWGEAIAGVDHPVRRAMAVVVVTTVTATATAAFDRWATVFFHSIVALGIVVITLLPLSVQP